MKATLSIRVEVQVDVQDETELEQIKSAFVRKAAEAVDIEWGSPTILHAAAVRRRGSG